MNNLIKQLAEKAGDDWGSTLQSDKEFLKKFAELVVWECVESLAEVDDNYMAVFQSHLLDHFGMNK